MVGHSIKLTQNNMALRNKYIKENGDIISGYYRVSEISTHYEKAKGFSADKTIFFDIQIYDDTTNEKITDLSQSVLELNQLSGYFALDTQDEPVSGLIVKAYEQLKAQDHFSDAIDC